jgi:hypothetical protein
MPSPRETTCIRCHGTEWVCENHPDKPMDDGCGCGMPCSCFLPQCPHYRLNEDGICRACGADRRGM